jgi:preprotein translocase subunit SecY
MKKFIETLQNIWSIKELRDKILYTIIILVIFRLGSQIVLPGVVASTLKSAADNRSATDLLNLINTFSGGAFNQGSIFALGVMPYITASIIIQLLGFAVPYFQKLQQREGESGRKKLNQYTRLLTVLITLVQGSAYLTLLVSQNAVSPNVSKELFFLSNAIILSAGSIFAMWLGERITDRGIGNGVSLIIMVGIIATLPRTIVAEIQASVGADGGGVLMLILKFIVWFFIILASILVVQGVRRIPLQFANRMVGRTAGEVPSSGARDYIPLKVNASGVMPIIFAQAIMFLPLFLAQMAVQRSGGETSNFLIKMQDFQSLPYNLIFFVLVVVFTYVYTALIVNPKQYADHLKRQNSFIPGVKPGEDTEQYIDSLTTRITLPGSIFLGLLAILPAIVGNFGVGQSFAIFFGGTSLLILVGVVLDTLQQIESYLLMKKYDGLIKSGKIKGRSDAGGMQIGASY